MAGRAQSHDKQQQRDTLLEKAWGAITDWVPGGLTQETKSLILPVVQHVHFSTIHINLDLAGPYVEHFDSLDYHVRDAKWITGAWFLAKKVMGELWPGRRMAICRKAVNVSYQTQGGITNNCAAHAVWFAEELLRMKNPTPLGDGDATTYRTTIGERIGKYSERQ